MAFKKRGPNNWLYTSLANTSSIIIISPCMFFLQRVNFTKTNWFWDLHCVPLPLGLEGTWEISALTKFLTCVVHILQRLILCVSIMKGGLTHLQSRSVAKAWLSPASAWLRCRLSMVGLRPVTVPLIRKWQICISNDRHNTHTTQMISQSQRGPRDHTGSRNCEMQAWECSPTCPSDFHSFFFIGLKDWKTFN